MQDLHRNSALFPSKKLSVTVNPRSEKPDLFRLIFYSQFFDVKARTLNMCITLIPSQVIPKNDCLVSLLNIHLIVIKEI